MLDSGPNTVCAATTEHTGTMSRKGNAGRKVNSNPLFEMDAGAASPAAPPVFAFEERLGKPVENYGHLSWCRSLVSLKGGRPSNDRLPNFASSLKMPPPPLLTCCCWSTGRVMPIKPLLFTCITGTMWATVFELYSSYIKSNGLDITGKILLVAAIATLATVSA